MNQKRDIITLAPVPADGSENTLGEYLRICRRHLWLIIIVTVGSTTLAGVWSYLQTPIYQAKATVVIEREGRTTLEKNEYSFQDTSPEYFQTHFELMRSHTVLERAAQLLHLSEQPEYQPRPSAIKGKVLGILPESIGNWLKQNEKVAATSEEEKEDGLLKSFSRHIDIMPVRGARLAHITVSSEDPKFAAKAADTLASVYIERTQELASGSKGKAAEWFTTHLEDLRKKVEAAQQTLYFFRAKHGLLAGQERQTLAAHKFVEVNSELLKAEMKKTEAQSRYEQIKSVLGSRTEKGSIDWSNLDASAEVLGSSLIQTLRTQEIKTSGEVAELSDKYGPLHPRLARAKAELQALRERIQQEVQKIYDSIKREYDLALTRERAIKDSVNRHSKEKIKLEQYEIEHGMLEREAQSNQHLYDMFLKVSKEADLSSGLRSNNVYLADPAEPSLIPVKPRKSLNTMLGLLVGLISGMGLALFRDARDRSLKGPDDLERYMPTMSLLGIVPLLPKSDAAHGRLLLPANAFGPAAESFRTIRSSLLLSSPSQLPLCVLITSPGESEGKTMLAVNLARVTAQLEDTRVILIDADLRKANTHPIFDIKTGNGKPKGLVDFLTGKAELREILHQTEIANLYLIPSGNCPPNPSELLHSKQMSKLLTWYREKGFHVILDAPPVLPVADPAILAPQVDGVLLVVSAGGTTREACRLAIQRLTASGGKFLGIVLQKAPVTDYPYYSGHYMHSTSRN
jgi:succinoglycan biosynthesis transport protein ExoP